MKIRVAKRAVDPTKRLGRIQILTLSTIQCGTSIFKGARKDLDATLTALERRHLIRLESNGFVLTECAANIDWVERYQNWGT